MLWGRSCFILGSEADAQKSVKEGQMDRTESYLYSLMVYGIVSWILKIIEILNQ